MKIFYEIHKFVYPKLDPEVRPVSQNESLSILFPPYDDTETSDDDTDCYDSAAEEYWRPALHLQYHR